MAERGNSELCGKGGGICALGYLLVQGRLQRFLHRHRRSVSGRLALKGLNRGMGLYIEEKGHLEFHQGPDRHRFRWRLFIVRCVFLGCRCGKLIRFRSRLSMQASHEDDVTWAFAFPQGKLNRRDCPYPFTFQK